MQPGPFPNPIGDESIPMTMQVEIEHLTLDEAVASGLFDLPEEPGMVQIPVTVHVSIPEHLLPSSPPPDAGSEAAHRSVSLPPPDGSARGSRRQRFGNYPKAAVARNMAGSFGLTPGFGNKAGGNGNDAPLHRR